MSAGTPRKIIFLVRKEFLKKIKCRPDRCVKKTSCSYFWEKMAIMVFLLNLKNMVMKSTHVCTRIWF